MKTWTMLQSERWATCQVAISGIGMLKFPNLLMACYDVVRECGLERKERFRGYFESSQ